MLAGGTQARRFYLPRLGRVVKADALRYNRTMVRNFEQLHQEILSCQKCGLCKTRKNAVMGEGNPHAAVMFIGEGPGRDEDEMGRPFVGRAGQLLDKMLGSIGFTRNDVYIANVVKCRPPGNRDPEPEEAGACIGYLRAQVALIRPKILVCLGRISAGYILGHPVHITQDRGKWHEVKGFFIMPTYHPAALLRNEPWKKDSYRDLLAIRAKYEDLIRGNDAADS
jgi:uracil-DNA glycosylase family 4